MEDHVMQCLLTPLNVWAPEWSIWTSASKQDNLNEPLECLMGVRVGRRGKMWAGYEVREFSWGRQITKGRMLWDKKLGKLTKKLGCPKGWPENNFLTFVTAKRLENFISMDWTERERIPNFHGLSLSLNCSGNWNSFARWDPQEVSCWECKWEPQTKGPMPPTSKATLLLN